MKFLQNAFVWLAALTMSVSAHAQVCDGGVIAPPEGMVEVSDSTLLASALGQAGKGGLCTGKVFEAQKPVKVYRVYDGDPGKAYTQFGRWWSFDAPKGPRDAYAKANAICPEWSPLNIVTECTLKVGTLVAVGPGQSADCANQVRLPASPANQVYVPNDSRSNVLFVEGCTPGTPWPTP
jgi:hypothetical protein